MTTEVAEAIESIRTETLATLDTKSQETLGQYFTPLKAAEIMVGLFDLPKVSKVRILDPGAGTGVLSSTLAQKVLTENPDAVVELSAIELDTTLHEPLTKSLNAVSKAFPGRIVFEILGVDFVDFALTSAREFDLVIQNPPYKKIPARSETNLKLIRANLGSPNIYATFIELGLNLLVDRGQLVSITPRSFMNGTYFSKLRKRVLSQASIVSLHIFHSRGEVFRDTGVLQEAIIVHWSKSSSSPSKVRVHSSVSHTTKIQKHLAPYELVVTNDFIYVPSRDADTETIEEIKKYKARLEHFGLKVSTGKVVDFRNRELISIAKVPLSYPMIYPTNLKMGLVKHPLGSKGQWFTPRSDSENKMLLPAGAYVVLKRFSSKEEHRRLVAAVLNTKTPVALDNKLNYIHTSGNGISLEQAETLAEWFNSPLADAYFRIFSGHTQVNAGDLNDFPIPDLSISGKKTTH